MRFLSPSLAVSTLSLCLPAAATCPRSGLDVDFVDCTEFAGLGLVPAANAQQLVPASYTVAGDGVDAILVVRVAQCDDVVIDGRSSGAGTVSQIGVNVAIPGSTADIDNYTLWYATDNARLKSRLTSAGAHAQMEPHLLYDVVLDGLGGGTLEIDSSPGGAPAYEVLGTITEPTADPVPFVASWYVEGPRGTVTMTTTFPDIAFGLAQTTLQTPQGSELADLIGDTTLSFPILDSYNTFPGASMTVQ